jgi:serine/threonine-protein kinase
VPHPNQSSTGTVYTGGSVPPPEPLTPEPSRDSRVIAVWDVPDSPGPIVRPLPASAPAATLNETPRRSPVKIIVAAVVAAWIVIAAVVLVVNLSDRPARASVPDVAGVSQDDAQTRLLSAGLKLGEVRFEDSTAVPPNMIIRTEPPAKQKVASGTRVTLVLARAVGDPSSTVALPDVANKSRDDAIAGLSAVGLTAGEEAYEESGTVAEGLVIRTEPPANSQVPQGSSVKLVLASKPGHQPPVTQPCTVPDVAHKPRDHAVSDLDHAKVPYQIKKEESHDVAAGTVIRTDPGAGRYDPCRKVTVYVSQGQPIHVPNVIGRGEDYARDTITGEKLKVSVKYDNYCGPSATKDAVVTAQNPHGGSTAHEGDTVSITLPKYTGVCPSRAAP